MKCTPWIFCVFTACGAEAPTPVAAAAVTDGPAVSGIVDPGPTALCDVPAGDFEPLFPGRDGKQTIPIAPFRIEAHAVSNAQFLAFVAAQPNWRRSRVAPLFADGGYLAAWLGELEPGAAALDRPVTGVSWFAARAYARWRGRRLPTLAEWERTAAVPLLGETDATRAALAWYSKPVGAGLQPVGTGRSTNSACATYTG